LIGGIYNYSVAPSPAAQAQPLEEPHQTPGSETMPPQTALSQTALLQAPPLPPAPPSTQPCTVPAYQPEPNIACVLQPQQQELHCLPRKNELLNSHATVVPPRSFSPPGPFLRHRVRSPSVPRLASPSAGEQLAEVETKTVLSGCVTPSPPVQTGCVTPSPVQSGCVTPSPPVHSRCVALSSPQPVVTQVRHARAKDVVEAIVPSSAPVQVVEVPVFRPANQKGQKPNAMEKILDRSMPVIEKIVEKKSSCCS